MSSADLEGAIMEVKRRVVILDRNIRGTIMKDEGSDRQVEC